jgi:hypothetical protein
MEGLAGAQGATCSGLGEGVAGLGKGVPDSDRILCAAGGRYSAASSPALSSRSSISSATRAAPAPRCTALPRTRA